MKEMWMIWIVLTGQPIDIVVQCRDCPSFASLDDCMVVIQKITPSSTTKLVCKLGRPVLSDTIGLGFMF